MSNFLKISNLVLVGPGLEPTTKLLSFTNRLSIFPIYSAVKLGYNEQLGTGHFCSL